VLALAIAKDEDRVLTPSGLREGTPSPLPRKVPVPRPRHVPRLNLWPSLLPRPTICPLPLPLPLPFLLLIKSSSGTSKEVAIQDKNLRPKVKNTALRVAGRWGIWTAAGRSRQTGRGRSRHAARRGRRGDEAKGSLESFPGGETAARRDRGSRYPLFARGLAWFRGRNEVRRAG